MTPLPIHWDTLSLNDGDLGNGLCTVVTNVDGWYGSPPLNGNDLNRALTDGAIFGFKTVQARVITIQGAVVCDPGHRDLINAFARSLAACAANPQPADLIIAEDRGAPDGTVALLSASVRADSDQLTLAWTGSQFFTYQVVLTAADPRLYEAIWQSVMLSPAAGSTGGRTYPLHPPRVYATSATPNAARLTNPGTAPVPVWVTYTGDLGESRLTDGINTIHLAPVASGQQIVVNTETLVAAGPGGVSRASYLMAGSSPLTIPASSTATWSLYGTGGGTVLLSWRGVWA